MTKKDTMPLVLIDGSSYLFRAYYAMPSLINSAGMPTGAIYGVMNMLRRLLKEYATQRIAVIFDSKGKTFRNELYEPYKANRSEMPEDLAVQIQPLHEMIRAMGFPVILSGDVEADDVIGTLSTQASQQGISTIISTGDKDMAQLVNAHVTLINTMTNTQMDEAGVCEKFGVPPRLIIDYLTLIGDTSDNIPGVPKVGPKTAVKWLDAYGSLAGVEAHASEIKGKVGESLRDSLTQLPLSRDLVTIRCYVKLEAQVQDLMLTEPNRGALKQYYTEYEFNNWLKEISDESVDDSQFEVESKHDYYVVLTEVLWLQCKQCCEQAAVIALDTETTSLNDMQAKLVGFSLAVEPGIAYYIPLAHDYEGAPNQLSADKVLADLRALVQDPSKRIVGHHVKYDYKVLHRAGVTITAPMDDTLLQSYVLNNVTTRHDMDTLAQSFLGRQTISFEEVAGKGAKQKTFNQIDIEVAGPYAAEDADITLQLYQLFSGKLIEDVEAKKVYETIDLPLMPILATMELDGVRLDAALLDQQSKALEQRIIALEKKAYDLAEEPFNLGSPKQLQEILFEKMNIPVIKKTPKGQPSTAESVLQTLALDHALPQVIVEYRRLAKLKSTYTDKLPLQVNPETKRIHTHYNQSVTATGRLSSNNPNLQNIPIRTEDGRCIRQAFVAGEGKKLVAADYSQVELRIMAHFSQDPGLLRAFTEGLDVHRATASEIFGIGLDEVTSDQRRHAKAINFGLLYGMSSFGLAQQLGINRSSAQEYMDCYFARYPGVQSFMDQVRQEAGDKGYVTTGLGRRLIMPEIRSKNVMRRRAAERAAINAPLQGTAADIIKLAMIEVYKAIKGRVDVKMLMQVHDELVFEVDDHSVDEVVSIVKNKMEGVVNFSVPLIVDVGVGDNWDEAH